MLHVCACRRLRQVEHIDTHRVIPFVVVHDTAWRDLFGLRCWRVAQDEIEGACKSN
jgi:hypothetical protein